MVTPRLQIDLTKIHHNTRRLVEHLSKRGVSVTGVTKVALGDPDIARVMLRAGVDSLGDSRIENIRKMREAGVDARFILLRTPQISRVSEVVEHADVSFNTELAGIEKLSEAATDQGKIHGIVLMVELGDLREGILPGDVEETVRQSLALPGVRVEGIGINLACLGGVKPDADKMKELSELAQSLEARFDYTLTTVSGGNSANFDWFFSAPDTARINNLRLGESIFLGLETLNRSPIKGLETDAMTLVTEVIESKVKPSVPSGEISQNAFGEKPHFRDRGPINHAILGIGRQDVLVSGLTPLTEGVEVFGASSDHVIVVSNKRRLQVGEEVSFHLTYGALLAAMTSPYVKKVFR